MNKSTTISIIIWALSAAMFGFMAWMRFNEALWNDEIYTLQYFVLKGLPTVLTDYHVPNNHILSNILHWIWLKVLGIQDIGEVLDHAWKIRIVPGLLSVVALGVMYRCGQLLHKHGGLTTVFIACTMLGFGSFAFQVRGYALSILLMSLLLYGCIAVLKKGHFERKSWILVVVSASLLLYSIPSNLYPIVSLGIMLVFALGFKQKSTWIQTSTAFGFAAIFAIALYWPVLDQVLNNDYVKAGKPLRAIHVQNFSIFISHLIGWKLLLLPVAAWGAWLLSKDSDANKIWRLLTGTLLIPFIISMLRGDEPPPRSFVVLIPVLALLLTQMWAAALDGVSISSKYYYPVQILGIVVSLFAFWMAYREAQKQVSNGMVERILLQSINYGYYQYYYKPNEEYDLFKQKYSDQILVIERSEDHDMPVYLKHKSIKSVPLDSIYPMMETQNTLFVSTRYPKNFIQNMEKMKGGWKCSYLQPQIRYPRIVICKR